MPATSLDARTPAPGSAPPGPRLLHGPPRERLARERRELLLGPSPRAVLRRLLTGDPLGLGGRVLRRLADRALLLDPEAVRLRAAALCAWHASEYRARTGLGRWVRDRVDAAIDELLAEDGLRVDASLVDALGSRDAARRAAAHFHDLALPTRRTFLELALDPSAIHGLARESGLGVGAVGARARAALLCLLEGSGEALER